MAIGNQLCQVIPISEEDEGHHDEGGSYQSSAPRCEDEYSEGEEEGLEPITYPPEED